MFPLCTGGQYLSGHVTGRDSCISRGRGEERRDGRMAYGSFENMVSLVLHTLTVSWSESTMSSRCVVNAAPSTAGPLPARPTRSVISKIMLVKPSLSR